MSYEYDEYLNDHIDNVNKAGQWLKRHSPIFRELLYVPYGYILSHDNSKYSTEEYDAYDKYFYGNNKSFKVVNDFNYAWLHHIHNNPHHWQYWVLINDDDGTKALEIPLEYVLEMIADWWSFSYAKGDYLEILDWYDKHKDIMILHEKTRKVIEDTLELIKQEFSK